MDKINIKHLSTIIIHQGLGHRTPFNHPRFAHNIIGYLLPYRSFSIRIVIVTWIGPKPKDNEKYIIFKKHSILNPWRAREDQRRVDRRARGEPIDKDIDTKAGPSRKRRRIKGKEPAVDVVYARPFYPNHPLRIFELNEGVTIADLSTAQPIFKGRGEIVPISDEEIEEPQFTNLEAKKLFGEGFLQSSHLRENGNNKGLEERDWCRTLQSTFHLGRDGQKVSTLCNYCK